MTYIVDEFVARVNKDALKEAIEGKDQALGGKDHLRFSPQLDQRDHEHPRDAAANFRGEID